MPTHLLAAVPSLTLVLSGLPRTEAQPRAPLDRPNAALSFRVGGLRTDRLSPKQLRVWSKIVAIVMANDGAGHPLHPTLRQLWDTVDTSNHVIHVEIPDRKGRRSYLAGRFAITKVDPEGTAHEGVLTLSLEAIDKVSTGPGASRAGGFIPFKGLRRNERYAEVLGHELAHAVWHLADTERARLAQRLQGDMEADMRMVLTAGGRSPDEELKERVGELDRLARELERPAETAELAIWKELRAGRRAR
jgi:hypothetical protein